MTKEMTEKILKDAKTFIETRRLIGIMEDIDFTALESARFPKFTQIRTEPLFKELEDINTFKSFWVAYGAACNTE